MTRHPPGLYRLHWKEGGSSLAAVGLLHSGANWYAPVNWTNAAPAGVVSMDLDRIERWESLTVLSETAESCRFICALANRDGFLRWAPTPEPERPTFSPEALEIARVTGVGNEQVLREVRRRHLNEPKLREAAAQALGALLGLSYQTPEQQQRVERVIELLQAALS